MPGNSMLHSILVIILTAAFVTLFIESSAIILMIFGIVEIHDARHYDAGGSTGPRLSYTISSLNLDILGAIGGMSLICLSLFIWFAEMTMNCIAPPLNNRDNDRNNEDDDENQDNDDNQDNNDNQDNDSLNSDIRLKTFKNN